MRKPVVVAAATLSLLLCLACKSSKSSSISEAEPDSLAFDIKPVSYQCGPGMTCLSCSYKDGGQLAKFRIELGSAENRNLDIDGQNVLNIGTGNGAFVSEPGSQPAVMLDHLRRVLEASRVPKGVTRVSRLPFRYVTLSKAKDPISLKLFLANDQAEVFLRLDEQLGKAEFAMKDPEYGDTVVGELAKVL